MSWKEKIENIKFSITTGDGKIFFPLWKNGVKSKDYNVSRYSFIDVSGDFVDRKKPQSSKFPLVFWFQGDDNIEQADAFETSADDPRPWKIKHPFYGDIDGQPISISRNDSSYNVTEISVVFWESINKDYPNPKRSIDDVIKFKTEEVSLISALSYSIKVKPTSADQQILQDNIVQISGSFDKLFDDDNFVDYQNAIFKATQDAGNLVTDSEQAINSAQSLLLRPSLFAKSVKSRINSFVNAFDKLKEMLVDFPTVNTKLYFEAQSAVLIASICQCTATPLDTDYITRTEIENITDIIINSYAEYLQILDDAQVDISDVQNTYHPDVVTQLNIYELVVETTGNLFGLAFSAKQERIIEVNKNTNLVLLTHKYLGLDANDENIEEFRQLNNIKNDELFNVKKGRSIKYFI